MRSQTPLHAALLTLGGLAGCGGDDGWLDADPPLFPSACRIDRLEEMCEGELLCPSVRVGGVGGCGAPALSPEGDLDCVLEALETRKAGIVQVRGGDPTEGCGQDDVIHLLGDDSAIQWSWTYNFENSGGSPSDFGYRLRLKSSDFFRDCRDATNDRDQMGRCLLDWYDPSSCNSEWPAC